MNLIFWYLPLFLTHEIFSNISCMYEFRTTSFIAKHDDWLGVAAKRWNVHRKSTYCFFIGLRPEFTFRRCTLSNKANGAFIRQTHNELLRDIWWTSNQFSLISHNFPIYKYLHNNGKTLEIFIKDLHSRVSILRL